MSRKFKFVQGQRILRSLREKLIFCQMSGNFTFESCKSLDVWSYVPFLLDLLNFQLRYCQGNLNLRQRNVRKFCSVLSVGTL